MARWKPRLFWGLLIASPLTALLLFFVLPLASCPNCTGTHWDEGTYGTYIDGKQVPLGCGTCGGHRITLYRRWTYRPNPD